MNRQMLIKCHVTKRLINSIFDFVRENPRELLGLLAGQRYKNDYYILCVDFPPQEVNEGRNEINGAEIIFLQDKLRLVNRNTEGPRYQLLGTVHIHPGLGASLSRHDLEWMQIAADCARQPTVGLVIDLSSQKSFAFFDRRSRELAYNHNILNRKVHQYRIETLKRVLIRSYEEEGEEISVLV